MAYRSSVATLLLLFFSGASCLVALASCSGDAPDSPEPTPGGPSTEPSSGASPPSPGTDDEEVEPPVIDTDLSETVAEVGGPTGNDIPLGSWKLDAGAATPVAVGSGSFASQVPSGVDSSVEATETANRTLYVVDPNRPIPTNDWWTTLLTDKFSGNLPAFPLWVSTSEAGVAVETQTGWEPSTDPNGRGALHEGRLTVTGLGFVPRDAQAEDWSDWGLKILLEENASNSMSVTLGHGLPFVWVEAKGMVPVVRGVETTFNAAGDLALPHTASNIGLRVGSVSYGLFAPEGTSFTNEDEGLAVHFSGEKQFLVLATLPSGTDLEFFAKYAYAIPRSTQVDWNYQPGDGRVATRWVLNTENLAGSENLDTIQCFIPHHYKKTQRNFELNSIEYFSPRGKMKCATGREFELAWPLKGIASKLPAPQVLGGKANPYKPEIMAQQIDAYAERTGYGNDTYWGGKDVLAFAKYMNFALETGNVTAYEKLKATLRHSLEDWFSFTPGEPAHFFALYPKWGALIGFSPSYWSEDFTDNHFHYGYFTYAAGLLAMVDKDFAEKYGEMATLVAKHYANYNREDLRFPMFRTFDPWMGHSYAGGLGEGGGNNQESSSEAMQSWIGLYTLGTALNNKMLRDAGAFGYAIEAQACAEYWFDRDGENLPTDWTHVISTPVHSNAVGFWTYFSGDPVWMHAINWLPIAPGFYYLVEDYDYAAREYADMMAKMGMQEIPDEWNSGLGNVVLSYLQLFAPDTAAAEFDRMWDAQSPVVRDVDTGGMSYYYTHSNRALGRIAWNAWTNLATSNVYLHPESGAKTVAAFNPTASEIEVSIIEDNVVAGKLKVAPGALISESY